MLNFRFFVTLIGALSIQSAWSQNSTQTPTNAPSQANSSTVGAAAPTPESILAQLLAQSAILDRQANQNARPQSQTHSTGQAQASTQNSALSALQAQSNQIDERIRQGENSRIEAACRNHAGEVLRPILNERERLLRNSIAPLVATQRNVLNSALVHLAPTAAEQDILRQTATLLAQLMQVGGFPEELQTYQGVNASLIYQGLVRYKNGERLTGSAPPTSRSQNPSQQLADNALWSITRIFSTQGRTPPTAAQLDLMIESYRLIQVQLERYYRLFGVRAMQLMQSFEQTSLCSQQSSEQPLATISEVISMSGAPVMSLSVGNRDRAFKRIFDEFFRQRATDDPLRLVQNSRPQYSCGSARILPYLVNTLRLVVELPSPEKPLGGLYAVACSFDRTAFLNMTDSSDINFACSEEDLLKAPEPPSRRDRFDMTHAINAVNYLDGIRSGRQHGVLNPARELRIRMQERRETDSSYFVRNPELDVCASRASEGTWAEDFVRAELSRPGRF